MNITAAMVKELREKTGSGMMDCKKALEQTGGDMAAAIDELRKKGLATAQKRAGRIAAEGLTAVIVSEDSKTAGVVEVNSETDFVANNDLFRSFVKEVADQVLIADTSDTEELGLDAVHDSLNILGRLKDLIQTVLHPQSRGKCIDRKFLVAI